MAFTASGKTSWEAIQTWLGSPRFAHCQRSPTRIGRPEAQSRSPGHRPPKAAARFERINHADLTDQTYEAIRGRILRRELKTGEQIPIDRVAADLGVSRTPVLDAIKRLSVEGLIGIRPRRGCFVLGLTIADIREIFGLREALETYAANCVIG